MRVLNALLLAVLLAGTGVGQTAKTDDLLRRLINLPAPVTKKTDSDDKKTEAKRDDEFYRWVNIPPDDAPLEDLLEYWKGQSYTPGTISYRKLATQKTAERLLEHLKDHPGLVPEYLGAMPTGEKTADGIRKIFSTVGESSYAREQMRGWLTHNTREGIPELTKQVRRIRDKDDYVSSEFQVALKALAKVDWDSARPHVERLESDPANPHSQVLAYWVRYLRAVTQNEQSETDAYRRKLQEVVENKTARWSLRDIALDALADGGDWSGRDNWYMSLFSDETLLEIQDNGNTGLTTMMDAAPSFKEWIERFIKMVRSENRAIRTAAARNLVEIYTDEQEIIEALLPWVTDPQWAKESSDNERADIIEALGKHDIAGAVPALITVLSTEEGHRQTAAKALGEKKDPRAAPVLRSLIAKESGEVLGTLLDALIACGGMSVDEQAADVEAYAEMTSSVEGLQAVEAVVYGSDGDDEDGGDASASKKKKLVVPVEVLIGKELADEQEPDDALVIRIMDREKALRQKQPELARRLADIMRGWRGRAIYVERLRALRSNEADLDSILNLLTERLNVREKLPNEIGNLRTANGITRGIGSCLGDAEDEYLSILGSGDLDAKVAMLGCTRLLRSPLPIAEITPLLNSKNETLKLAAERYLEAEDSVVSRRAVLARYRGEARIMGAFTAFLPDTKQTETSHALSALFTSVSGTESGIVAAPFIRRHETQLRSEILADEKLVAIFAKLPEDAAGQQVIRVYKDRVTYTNYEDTARYFTRDLTEKEYKDFHSFLVTNKIDEVPPIVGGCHHGCNSSEYLMLGRDGGRRTFVYGYPGRSPLDELEKRFADFQTKDLKLTYRLGEKIKGLEVLLADDRYHVYAVWKNDNDLRFLMSDADVARSVREDLNEKAIAENSVPIDDEDEEIARKVRNERYQAQEKRRDEAADADLSWRTLKEGKPGATVFQPDAFSFVSRISKTRPEYRTGVFASLNSSSRDGGGFSAGRYARGIVREDSAGTEVLVREGSYDEPVANGDKTWIVATKYTGENLRSLVRINLRSGQEMAVTPPSRTGAAPIAYLPSHDRILVYSVKTEDRPELEKPTGTTELVRDAFSVVSAARSDKRNNIEYLLLDPATGKMTPVKGEFRPIEQSGMRLPQPSSTPGTIWAAIYDEASDTTRIGLYAEKTFTFTPVTTLPDIALRTSQIWVHEAENKVYFVYNGHLLTAPLRQQ